jgi:UDP-N-acetyl-D-galactosamine dehydrogenase
VKKEFGLTLNGAWPKPEYYDAVLLAVAHREFLSIDVRKLLRNQSAGIVYDIKSVLNREAVDGRL